MTMTLFPFNASPGPTQGGGSGITRITDLDEQLLITSPTGPTADIGLINHSIGLLVNCGSSGAGVLDPPGHSFQLVSSGGFTKVPSSPPTEQNQQGGACPLTWWTTFLPQIFALADAGFVGYAISGPGITVGVAMDFHSLASHDAIGILGSVTLSPSAGGLHALNWAATPQYIVGTTFSYSPGITSNPVSAGAGVYAFSWEMSGSWTPP